jgi:WD40 repeat protein
MNYDVFICHSSKDKTTANTICGWFEENGVTCWIAPRNVQPGSIYAEEIMDGIESSLSVLLILTENSNESQHVRNEIEQGMKREKVIFTVLLENIKPSKALDYYTSTSQWVEAWTPPLKEKIIELSGIIKALRGRNIKKHVSPVPDPVPKPGPVGPDLPDPGGPNPEPGKEFDELLVILSDQMEKHAFEKAESTITKILVIDPDNQEALYAGALIDKKRGFGKIKSISTPGIPINAFFTSDGRKIIAGCRGVIGKPPTGKSPSVIIWDILSEQKLTEYSIQTAGIPIFMDLSTEQQSILIADPFKIYLISISNGKITSEFQTDHFQCASFLPGGLRAVTGGEELLLWDLELESVMYRFKGNIGRTQSLAVTLDGKTLITGGKDGEIRSWDLQAKKEIWRLDRYQTDFRSMAVSSDGKQILAGNSKIICLLDLTTGDELVTFPGHNGCLCIAISPDGQKALSGGTDNILRYYDLKEQVRIRNYQTTGSWTGSVGFSPDGRFAFSGDLGNINIWALPG